ncbi:uncharacterized protein BO87DRAFT_388389 [Aspergillus neoniger CBS 115656]|uniref:Uncharacterized protein n=1 Tax=Aspergillus neoniger (strain CBS 115656) TaxID=1448310 RepID=A0A318Z626_ASPNB|nr:hypothetical protein BO87DRAFT_388389 [Aspergillus neoniger CBS 115656]PYH32402.1 hypothetical protein BO87DRAFT_388389 [Aspergillus neoniger CBS 115656]
MNVHKQYIFIIWLPRISGINVYGDSLDGILARWAFWPFKIVFTTSTNSIVLIGTDRSDGRITLGLKVQDGIHDLNNIGLGCKHGSSIRRCEIVQEVGWVEGSCILAPSHPVDLRILGVLVLIFIPIANILFSGLLLHQNLLVCNKRGYIVGNNTVTELSQMFFKKQSTCVYPAKDVHEGGREGKPDCEKSLPSTSLWAVMLEYSRILRAGFNKLFNLFYNWASNCPLQEVL